MPSTLDAMAYFQEHGVLFAPAKAANAGGVAVSALEMAQNSERLSWPFEKVDATLKDIMRNIFEESRDNAAKYGVPDNYVAGGQHHGLHESRRRHD